MSVLLLPLLLAQLTPQVEVTGSGLEIVRLEGGHTPWFSFRLLLPLGGAGEEDRRLARAAALALAEEAEEAASELEPRPLARRGVRLKIETSPGGSTLCGAAEAEHLDAVLGHVLSRVSRGPPGLAVIARALERARVELLREAQEEGPLSERSVERALGLWPAAGRGEGPLDAARVARIIGERLRAGSVVLGVAGPAELFAGLAARIEEWTRALPPGRWEGAYQLPAMPPPTNGVRVILVDRPGQGEATLFAAQLGLRAVDPRWAPATALDTLLGASYTSRLAARLLGSEARAAYAVSGLDGAAGTWWVRTTAEAGREAEVVRALLAELSALDQGPLGADELTFARERAATRLRLALAEPHRALALVMRARAQGLPASAPLRELEALERLAPGWELAARGALAPASWVVAVSTQASTALEKELLRVPGVKAVSVARP